MNLVDWVYLKTLELGWDGRTVEPDQILGSTNDNEWETGRLGWWFGIAILMKGITTFGLKSQDQKHLSKTQFMTGWCVNFFLLICVKGLSALFRKNMDWDGDGHSSAAPPCLSSSQISPGSVQLRVSRILPQFGDSSYKSHGLWISFYPPVVSLKQLANWYRFYRWPIYAIYIHLPSSSFDGLH